MAKRKWGDRDLRWSEMSTMLYGIFTKNCVCCRKAYPGIDCKRCRSRHHYNDMIGYFARKKKENDQSRDASV